MFKSLILLVASCLELCHGAAVPRSSASSLTAALIRAPPALWSEPILSRVYNGVDINATTDLAVKYIKRATQEGAQLIAFPELWFPGYPRGNDDAWIGRWAGNYVKNSITVGDANWKKLTSAAGRNSVYLALGFSERVGDVIYMAQALIDPKGEVLIHRHKLRPSGGERKIWSDGTSEGFKVVNTTYGRIGMLECWEHFHPAMTFPMQAQDEAIHIAAWPYTPDYNDPAALAFEAAEVNMAAASVYATSSGAYTLVTTVGRAAAFGPDGREIASIPAYLPAEAAPFLMITINTTGFADRPAYDVDGQQSWGVLEEIREGWPKGVPKVDGTFTDGVFNNVSQFF
ncbi:aliphatic nitrilase-like protein [Thelonectria olida]|uniref:Aliphatic nitrilase-like protein n=1 Tax=Thelonectria olida TaxID=1576542 RepID=A0A9P9AHZ4_9HYPO|nr:aliphatic nitrilase-like protein [Thelonectria olida]